MFPKQNSRSSWLRQGDLSDRVYRTLSYGCRLPLDSRSVCGSRKLKEKLSRCRSLESLRIEPWKIIIASKRINVVILCTYEYRQPLPNNNVWLLLSFQVLSQRVYKMRINRFDGFGSKSRNEKSGFATWRVRITHHHNFYEMDAEITECVALTSSWFKRI